jgi:predicted DNA-binding protein
MEKTTRKAFNFRLPADLIDRLKFIADRESTKQGFQVTVTDLLEKAIRELIANTTGK